MGKRRPSSTESPPEPQSAASDLTPSRQHVLWVVVAALLVVLGTLVTLGTVRTVSENEAESSRKQSEQTSMDVASTLQLAIQHEEDLVFSTKGFVLGDPGTTNSKFVAWAESVQAFTRYPELQGFGYVAMITAADLPAFLTRIERDPVGGPGAGASFSIIPPGQRAFYCLASLGETRAGPGSTVPAGVDFCADTGADLSPTRDTGLNTYTPYAAGKTPTLAIEIPVYRGGVVPATVTARRAAFQGWVGMLLSPKVLLDRALVGHPGTAVSFHFQQGVSNATFSDGIAPPGARAVAVDLHNGWTVTTFSKVAATGMFASRSSLALFLTGMTLTALLAALVLILGTGRARAVRLVRERTGELRYQALHDALTELPNRALIMDRIDQLLARNRRHGTTGALLFVDLDEFKNVNDSLGHAAGDRLLVAVAARMEAALRDTDTIGRMGGDEFVVLIDDARLMVAPELVAERVLEVMRQPFELEGAPMPLTINATIGIAIGDRDSAGELLRDADVALYQAKAAGKNRYEVFHPEMHTEIAHKIELEFDLRSALENQQFRLVYQPIYDLADLSLLGVEALIRWDHPTLGEVQPDEFIPILEDNGQIRSVGRWVLQEACRQMAAWHSQGDTLDISVNVSGRQLDSDSILADITTALDSNGLPPTSLIIEVTETALMRDPKTTAKRLRAINDLGVRIAVDDFGTGYSSLAYLQQFPVDCIKIDRAFTSTITSSPDSKAIIGTLVQLGKALGLRTLAEGVETPEQMDHLRGERVNQAQGFLLARPLTPRRLETQILEPRRTPGVQAHS